MLQIPHSGRAAHLLYHLPLFVCTSLKLRSVLTHPSFTPGGIQLVLGSLWQQHSLLLAALIALSVGDTKTRSQQNVSLKLEANN